MTTMIQCRLLLTLWLASMLLATPASANEQYNQGSEFAKGIKGQEQAAIGGFDPAGALPSYTSAPPESGYYGGVTNASTDLTSQGNAALNQSEVGKTITESILNTPAGNKPSMDAPFISVGTDAQDKAESVTDGSFDGCVEQEVTNTEYTNHVCSRDTRVDQYCSRTAKITGDWSGGWTQKYITIQPSQFSYYMSGGRVAFNFTAPESGQIISATMNFSGTFFSGVTSSFLNTFMNVARGSANYPLNAAGMNISKGQVISGDIGYGNAQSVNEVVLCGFLGTGCLGQLQTRSTSTLTMILNVEEKVFNPREGANKRGNSSRLTQSFHFFMF